jgi:2-phospho-L-lactate transferase/gluconeogenesis factor (CofD/UPF0052 family)
VLLDEHLVSLQALSSLYTSLLGTFVVPGVAEAMTSSSAGRIFVCNAVDRRIADRSARVGFIGQG